MGERTLYADDLSVHAIMTDPDTSFWDKMTDTSSNKNRYVTNTMLALFWKLVGNRHAALLNNILLLSNLCMMSAVFFATFFCLDLKNLVLRALVAGGGAFWFASSRFAYYSYGEVFGLMENLATGLAIIILACLWKDNFKFKKFFWIANILYPFLIYTHERYAVFAGVIAAYCFLACAWSDERISKKTFLRALPVVLMFALFMAQRVFLFKNRFLDGTSGVDAISSFNAKTFLFMASKCLCYLMGVGAPGDSYLSGIPVSEVPLPVYFCTAIVLAFSFMTLFLFAKQTGASKKIWLKHSFCFLALALLCAVCSATIRVEMRWMYAPLGILIFCLANMFAFLLESSGTERRRSLSLAGVLALLMAVTVENFYVRHWTDIYNWWLRTDAVELAWELKKYPKIDTLYIISKTVPLEEANEAQVHGIAKLERVPLSCVVYVKDLKDLDYVGANDVVLFRMDETNDYCDVTESYRGK